MKLREFRSVFDLSMPFGKPTSEQLIRINERLRSPLKDSEIFIFPFCASNRKVDSYFSVMDDSSLRNYAEDYDRGLSVLGAHNDRVLIPTGRTFESRWDSEAGQVLGWGYIARGINLGGGQTTDDVIRAIETGTIQDGSIRFNGGYDQCEICNQRLFSRGCDHMPGREYEINDQKVIATYRIIDARAKEYSLVPIGATPEAGIIRKAHLLKERGLITIKELTGLSRRLSFNLRTAIEGEEYLKFDFESELSDDDGDEGSENHDQDPVTGKQDKNDSAKDKPDQYVSTDSDLDGRNVTDEEINIRYWTNYLKERAAELSPENVAEIRTYLEAMDRKEKVAPPVLKANTHSHSHSHGDQAHDHEHKHSYGPMDDHSHSHETDHVGDGYYNDDSPSEFRIIKPARTDFRLEELIRASVIPVGVDKGVPDPGEMDMAGLIMPGMEPLQDVPYKVWESEEGSPIPGDVDTGSTQDSSGSLDVPELHIEPSGIIKFLYNGKEAVSSGVGLGGMIPMSSSMKGDYAGEFREEPIKIRLDAENLRTLLTMSQDGAFYRQRLMRDLVRFGCLKDGNSFDKDFHVRIASKMSTAELAIFVDSFRRAIEEKFKSGEIQHVEPSEFFPTVERRQTVGAGARSTTVVAPTTARGAYNPLERNELYSDRN